MKHITYATVHAALFATAALFTGAIQAQDKTRAEVRVEAASANKSGTVVKGEASAGPAAKSTKSRAEVKAERDAAKKMTTAERTTGDAGVAPLPKSTKSRAEVKTERDASKTTDAAKAKDYTPTK